jgi:hypothetical protein
MLSIKGLDKAAVLKALFDRSRPQGMGWLHGGRGLSQAEAALRAANLTPTP